MSVVMTITEIICFHTRQVFFFFKLKDGILVMCATLNSNNMSYIVNTKQMFVILLALLQNKILN